MSRDAQDVCAVTKGGTVLNSGAFMFLRSETQKPLETVRNTRSKNPKKLRPYLLGLRTRKDDRARIIQTIVYSCQHICCSEHYMKKSRSPWAPGKSDHYLPPRITHLLLYNIHYNMRFSIVLEPQGQGSRYIGDEYGKVQMRPNIYTPKQSY